MMEALFFRCYYAYLKGDFKEAKLFFDFLKEEFHNTRDKNALNKYQLNQLKEVSVALKTGKVSAGKWIEQNEEDIKIEKGKSDKNHKQLVRAIYDSSNQLKDLLGICDESFHVDNIEQPCGNNERIDMVYMDSVYAYPVEVKPGLGGHDVVGQILKYDLSLRMNLHLKFWKEVKPITICWDYSDFARKELKKRNVITIKHSSTEKGLKLQLI